MNPADQRLAADDAPGVGVDLGLVVQLELVVLNRHAQRIFHAQPRERVDLHLLGVALDAVVGVAPAQRTERHLGGLEQALGAFAVLGEERQPGAEAQVQCLLAELHRRTGAAQQRKHLGLDRLAPARTFEEQAEVVGVQARHARGV